jgi:2-keto-4-pentenoate hydratase/2-oxohepta-3-ene-1,7-dioic acid hydratase in catechol pathway
MRLVTFDRRGHRRLGAILGGEVVDLPDAIGHPAFPTTLEALVAASGGTVLDAARAALERDDAMASAVPDARILTPLFPTSLLSPDAHEVERRVVGPEQEVPWPDGAAWLDYEPKVAAVLGREARAIDPEEAQGYVFGYTLVNDWTARMANGDPMPTAEGLPIAIGPCIVTSEDVEPQSMVVEVKVDGEQMAKGNLNGAARNLMAVISGSSRLGELERGDAFALGPFGGSAQDPSRQLWPGATIELAAEGIGTLRNRLGARQR